MEKPARVVFDIETLAYPLASFDAQQQEYLLRFARTEEERNDALLKMNLSPFTARGHCRCDAQPRHSSGAGLLRHPGGQRTAIDDGLVELLPCAEEELLTRFWDAVSHYPRINHIQRPCFRRPLPYAPLRDARSAVNAQPRAAQVSARPNIVNLLEQLTFYVRTRKVHSRLLLQGITVSGARRRGDHRLDLGTLVGEGRYREVAGIICLGDVRATAELFLLWEAFLSWENERSRSEDRLLHMRRGSRA